MKTLVLIRHASTLMRHAILDKPNAMVSPEGLDLARRQGHLIANRRRAGFDWVFFEPFYETGVTALKFCEGLRYFPQTIPVAGMDYGALLAEVETNEFKQAVKSGLSNFTAITLAHGENKAKQWAEMAHTKVLFMFDQMENTENAVGFFYNLTIELAAASCGSKVNLSGLDKLDYLQGLVFSYESRQKILVTRWQLPGN